MERWAGVYSTSSSSTVAGCRLRHLLGGHVGLGAHCRQSLRNSLRVPLHERYFALSRSMGPGQVTCATGEPSGEIAEFKSDKGVGKRTAGANWRLSMNITV